MKTARSFMVIFCFGAVLAAAIVFLGRVQEVRRLETEVRDAQLGNTTLLNQLRPAGAPARPSPDAQPAVPAPADPRSAAKAGSIAALAELRRWLELHPDKSIPEIALLTEDYCLTVAATVRPGSDPDLRQGARMLRTRARQLFGERAASALADYAEANAGALPTTMMDLAPYLDLAIDEPMLRRYQVLARGNYATADPKAPLIGEVAGVDEDFDSVLSVSRTALTKVTSDRTVAEMQRALHRYLAMQGGKAPADTAALIPYLTFPISGDVLSKYTINSEFNISQKK